MGRFRYRDVPSGGYRRACGSIDMCVCDTGRAAGRFDKFGGPEKDRFRGVEEDEWCE